MNQKVVLVTGSGQGIGRVVAKFYANEGYHVVLCDRNGATIQAVKGEIESYGGKAEAKIVDISVPNEIESLFQWVNETFGRLDILINNAATSKWKSPLELTVDEWDLVLHTNLRGPFLCAREGAKLMKKVGGGSIVNIASTRALMSEPNGEAYAASKGGILALTHALAASLSEEHIQVNAISPGWIHNGDEADLKPEDHLQHFSGRVGKPEDIARACLFLTQENNEFISGTNIVVDGGMTRKMIYVE